MEDLIELAIAGFVIYLIYQFIVGLIMPVSRAASQMKNKMAEFQNIQREQMRQQQNAQAQQAKVKVTPKTYSKDDDYIDFEEVK